MVLYNLDYDRIECCKHVVHERVIETRSPPTYFLAECTAHTTEEAQIIQEEGIQKDLKKHALKQCDDIVKEFASCSQGRTISVTWACNDKWRAMQRCMRSEMSEEKADQAKLQYLRERRRASTAA